MELADDLHELAGVNIDAPVDEHIVRAAQNTVVHGHGKPAGARPGQQAAKVVSAVAQQGGGFFAQAGDHHFAHLPVRAGAWPGPPLQ